MHNIDQGSLPCRALCFGKTVVLMLTSTLGATDDVDVTSVGMDINSLCTSRYRTRLYFEVETLSTVTH